LLGKGEREEVLSITVKRGENGGKRCPFSRFWRRSTTGRVEYDRRMTQEGGKKKGPSALAAK